MSNTNKIVYLYRDAGNYKFWGEFFVLGDISLADLRPYLLDAEYFVPEKIGIASLVPDLRNDDDHLLHEFDSVASVDDCVCAYTALELITLVRKARTTGWFSNIAGGC